MTKEKPEFYTDKHKRFLDTLRDSGKTNMFGARPYLKKAFPELDDKQAAAVVTYWMASF